MGEEKISHFTHPHPLVFVPSSNYEGCQIRDDLITCGICSYLIKDECYKCIDSYCKSSYALHTSCAKFPEKKNHPFHPHHALVFTTGRFWWTCSACGGEISEYSQYACMDCEYYTMCLKCAALTPISQVAKSNLPNIRHQHSFMECLMSPDATFKYYCGTCGKGFKDSDRVYACQECRSLMHLICARLPNEINHPFHLEHSLKLIEAVSPEIYCAACGKDSLHPYVVFQCSICKFTLDSHCASLMPTSYRHVREPLTHYHPHPLIECQSSNDFETRCLGCGQPFEDTFIYVCLKCGILLDSFCANLPSEILHPLHPQHRLILGKHEWWCSLCSKPTNYNYKCGEDDYFYLDVHCANVKLNFVRSEIHKHDLAYFSFEICEASCTSCRKPCNKFVFGCVQCNWYIHDHCFPWLPQTIKHECHCDPLTLVCSPIKDYPDQEVKEAEFYCFACEELRELDHPTYYCAECHFVAHVHCVISEIITYLKAQPKRSIGSVETYSNTYSYALPETSECSNSENADSPLPEVIGHAHLTEEAINANSHPVEIIRDTNLQAVEQSKCANSHSAEQIKEANPEIIDTHIYAAEGIIDASPQAAVNVKHKTADSPGPHELDDEIALLQKQVDVFAAELSILTEKINELKEREPRTAASLVKKLLGRIDQTWLASLPCHVQGHDQIPELI